MNIGSRFNPYKSFNGIIIPEAVYKISSRRGHTNRLSLGAKVTYARLMRYAGENGYAYPKKQTIADELGVSLRSVEEYLRELIQLGIIECKRRGKKRSNTYYFLWHEIFEPKTVKAVLKDVPNNDQHSNVGKTGNDPRSSVVPYEESQLLRESMQTPTELASSKSELQRSTERTYIQELQEEKLVRRDSLNPKDGNKVAMRLVRKFQTTCREHGLPVPVVNVGGNKRAKSAITTHGLTEGQVEDLFDEWFSLGKPDDETVSITRALSTNQINAYKARNSVE